MTDLEKVQKRIDERGIRDIKITWNRENTQHMTKEQITKDAVYIMNQYLDGNFTDAEPVGDSTIKDL